VFTWFCESNSWKMIRMWWKSEKKAINGVTDVCSSPSRLILARIIVSLFKKHFRFPSASRKIPDRTQVSSPNELDASDMGKKEEQKKRTKRSKKEAKKKNKKNERNRLGPLLARPSRIWQVPVSVKGGKKKVQEGGTDLQEQEKEIPRNNNKKKKDFFFFFFLLVRTCGNNGDKFYQSCLSLTARIPGSEALRSFAESFIPLKRKSTLLVWHRDVGTWGLQ